MPWINKAPKKKRDYRTQSRKDRSKSYNTSQWRQLRRDKLYSCCYCEVCKAFGRIELAEAVHHVRSPFQDGITQEEAQRRLYDFNNLLSVSTKCHADIHAGRYSVFAYADGTKEIKEISKNEKSDILAVPAHGLYDTQAGDGTHS